jgi:phosphoglycolate phosphatase-like HAD superfamily hydrolase
VSKSSSIILWDIDGTLLKISNVNIDKHLKAINNVLNVYYSGISDSSGMTDLEIIRAIANKNSRELSTKEIDSIFENLDELTVEEMYYSPLGENINISHTLQVIKSLGLTNGILTGNSPKRAISKIDSAGLHTYFDFNFAYFGDAALDRINLVENCTESLNKYNLRKIIIVGDSPRDIQAAKNFGLDIVAIATGKHSYQELLTFNPNLLLHDLEIDFDIFINYLENFAI